MGKIAIVTLNGYFNYGNRLQNYALQGALESQGYYVETLLVNNKDSGSTNKANVFINRAKSLKGKSAKYLVNKIIYKAKNIIHKKAISKANKGRTKIFEEFTNQYIRETSYSISENNIPLDLPDSYDFFVAGSDQVWNPSAIKGASVYFLTFAPQIKRLAYAPSFGFSEIPEGYKDNYRRWLSEMKHLSVREEEGAKIIKELTGKNVPVLVDPTLLLTKEEWIKISKEPSLKPTGKYLLTYFLGDIPIAYKQQIRAIAKQYRLEVINLGDIKADTYQSGPGEFIDYIDGSSFFCTDSFHGAVFSILFEKPFLVYERKGGSLSMYSRIETLLDKFKLTSRRAEHLISIDDVFNLDFSHIPPILEAERQKALDYLRTALEIKDEN